MAQRLARTLCNYCREETKITKATLAENGFQAAAGIDAYDAVGCRRCGGTGYRGRTGIYETMPMTDEIRALVLERASAATVAEVAVAQRSESSCHRPARLSAATRWVRRTAAAAT